MKKFLSSPKGKISVTAALAGIAAIAVLVFVMLSSPEQTGYRNIIINDLLGKVTADNNGSVYKAYRNMHLTGGCSLETEDMSFSTLLLDDDKFIKLEENSRAVFSNLGNSAERRTVIDLEYGSMSAEITSPLAEDEDFVVNTPNAVLAVRGTYFTVKTLRDEKGEVYTDVMTLGGSVKCELILPDGTVLDDDTLISAGRKARIKKDDVTTVYIDDDPEEKNVDRIDIDNDISDELLVQMFDSSYNGHELFLTTEKLTALIDGRGINTEDHTSRFNNLPIFRMERPDAVRTEAPETEASSAVTSSEEQTETGEAPAEISASTTRKKREPLTRETEIAPSETVSPAEDAPSEGISEAPDNGADNTVQPAVSSSAAVSDISDSTLAPPDVTSSAAASVTSNTYPVTSAPAADTAAASTTTARASSTAATSAPEPTEESSAASEAPRDEETSAASKQSTSAKSTTSTSAKTSASKTTAAKTTSAKTTTEKTTTAKTTKTTAEKTARSTTTTARTTTVPATTSSAPETTASNSYWSTMTTTSGSTVTTAHVHSLSAYVSNKDATCTKDGTKTAVCLICGEKSTLPDTGSATGHKETETRIEPTAEKTGLLTVKCSVCGMLLRESVLPALGIEINGTSFPDGVFRKYVSENFDTDRNGYLSAAERFAVKKIDVSGPDGSDGGISDLKGTENFSELEILHCYKNKGLVKIDLSGNPKLKDLHCGHTGMASLDLSKNPALEQLTCWTTALTSLDVSKNSALTELRCSDNAITSLDLSANPALTVLYCSETRIRKLDLSGNPSLTVLHCYGSEIETINVSGCPELRSIRCDGNRLAYLDLTGNPKVSCELGDNRYPLPEGTERFDLSTIEGFDFTKASDFKNAVFDSSTGLLTGITGDVEYTYDCGQDIRGTFMLTGGGPDVKIAINGKNFPDEIFREYISEKFDTNKDGHLSVGEINDAVYIDVGHKDARSAGISSLKGVEYFTALRSLYCDRNFGLTSLDLSKNTGLVNLTCNFTGIKELDLSKNTALSSLNCGNTAITSLDVSGNTALTMLYCNNTDIAELDVSKNTALKTLGCSETKIASLNLSNNAALTTLYCYKTDIASLDISGNTDLKGLDCGNTGIAALDVSNNTALETLTVEGTDITAIDVGKNAALKSLSCGNTGIRSLDVSKNTVLDALSCGNTGITALDLSNNAALTKLDCSGNGISKLDLSNNAALTELYCSETKLSELDLSGNTALKTLYCRKTNAAYLDLTKNTALSSVLISENKYTFSAADNDDGFLLESIRGIDINRMSNIDGAIFDSASGKLSEFTGDTVTYTYDCGNGISETFSIVRINDKPNGVEICEENFPDKIFREYISENFDTNKDGYLSLEEREAIKEIAVGGKGISSLNGIEYFGLLENLNCSDNAELKKLDLSSNRELKELNCCASGITALDLKNNKKLVDLNCRSTGITSLDVTGSTLLERLDCSYNNITGIDVSKNSLLTHLGLNNTSVSAVDLSANRSMVRLDISYTNISSVDLSACIKLEYLYCNHSPLTSLDVAGNTLLRELICKETGIAFIDVSNNNEIEWLDASSCRYTIPSTVKRFDLKTIKGFDIAKVSNVAGAKFDSVAGELYSFTSGGITYTYDCGNGHSEKFTIAAENGSWTAGEKYISWDESYDFDIPFRVGEKRTYYFTMYNTVTLNTGFLKQQYYEVPASEAFDRQTIYIKLEDGDMRCSITFTAKKPGSASGALYFAEDKSKIIEYSITCSDQALPDGVEINSINFPDDKFRAYVSENFDTDGDGLISKSEADSAAAIDVSGTAGADGDIRSLAGTENFPNLKKLYCGYNAGLTALDVSGNTALEELWCNNTGITELDISGNTSLLSLWCSETGITTLDVRSAPDLKILFCAKTGITALDVSGCAALTSLDCSYTGISALNVSNNTELKELKCYSTDIEALDLSNNAALEYLYCMSCRLAYFDVSANANIVKALSSGNIRYIEKGAETFDVNTISGIDPKKITDVFNADYDSGTGIFSNIIGNISYTYDCGRGISQTFWISNSDPGTVSLSAEYQSYRLRAISEESGSSLTYLFGTAAVYALRRRKKRRSRRHG